MIVLDVATITWVQEKNVMEEQDVKTIVLVKQHSQFIIQKEHYLADNFVEMESLMIFPVWTTKKHVNFHKLLEVSSTLDAILLHVNL